jgi:hypothetical protein
VVLDESGVGFTPPVRRTWAPRGKTPILRHSLALLGARLYRQDVLHRPAGVGWAAVAPQPPHAGVHRQPARLAGGGAAARLRPELNPVEGLWSNLKGQELANYAADTLDDLTRTASVPSPASAAARGCCSPSSTAPGFRYDQPSPCSENIFRWHHFSDAGNRAERSAGILPLMVIRLHVGNPRARFPQPALTVNRE